MGLLLMFKNSKKSKFKRIYFSRYPRFNVGEYYIEILIKEVIFDLFRVNKKAKHDQHGTYERCNSGFEMLNYFKSSQ
jgi:hypothetical protein